MAKTQKKATKETGSWASTLKRFPEANFLQSPTYGKMNELLGHKVISKEFGDDGKALMIVRDAKRGRYL